MNQQGQEDSPLDEAQASTASVLATVENTAQAALEQELATPQTVVEAKKATKKQGHKVLLGLAGLLFVSSVAYGTFFALSILQPKAAPVTSDTVAQKVVPKVSDTSTATDSGSDLDKSLNALDNGLTQATTDLTSADSSVDDSNQQIAVPTE